MARSSGRAARPKRASGANRLGNQRLSSPYLVIARAPDGRPRTETFGDTHSYRRRLATLQSSDTISIDEIVTLLDN